MAGKNAIRPPVDRRQFIQRSLVGMGGLALVPGRLSDWAGDGNSNPGYEPSRSTISDRALKALRPEKREEGQNGAAVMISTWNHGMPANAAGWDILRSGGSALDAVESGGRVPEADPSSMSVGVGGLPDRDGRVTLDASIMDHGGRCGSVCFLQHYPHPVSVARRVMEKTPHVMLAGSGAEHFAESEGFKRRELLTPEAKAAWMEWRKTASYQPPINIENHDTIGLLALDAQGRLAGACTTSGLAYKMHGRVGDSPIIGAGLYVDGEVGGATATGLGEMVIKVCGSFLVVELMRQGASPQEACEEAVRRIAARQDVAGGQVGFLALDRSGRTGAYAIHPGFNYALTRESEHELHDAASLMK